MSEVISLRRRTLMKAGLTAGGGLLLGFSLPRTGRSSDAAPAAAFTPNAFIHVRPDDSVTFILGKTEMGQGVLTSLSMLIAEELDVVFSSVRVESAPVDPAYNNPLFGVQMTGGSTSVASSWEPLRRAGAVARTMLVAAAAETWGVSPASCRTEGGFVEHTASQRRLSYGRLAEKASRLAPPKEVVLKAPKDFTLIGKPTKRLDTPDKTDGKAIFGMDVSVPGMLVALVARPPVLRGMAKSFDAVKAKAVPGVRAVVPIESGIAVVADGYWAASKGRDALDVVWEEGPLAGFDDQTRRRQYAELAGQPGAVARREGDAVSAMARATKRIEAVYELPYLAHAMMEPLNCVADVRPERCDVWVGTQFQTLDRGAAANAAGLKPEQVMLHTTLAGGGFGRRGTPDGHFVREAVLLSKAVEAPVKAIWTREDDIRGGYYRPASRHALAAGLDANGTPTVWTHRVVCQSVLLGTPFEVMVRSDRDLDSVDGAVSLPYDIPNLHVDVHTPRTGPPVWAWRSVGSSHNGFVVESFIDELAHAAAKDPYEFRRELLRKQPRYRAVLELAAERAGWGTELPRGHGLGIAVHSFDSIVAQVAEVSVSNEGEVTVHRVVCAVDCGTCVNPDTVRAQMEGGIVFGLSAALFGEITFEKGRVQESNFHDYRILRINEMPLIEVEIASSREPPLGVGEAGVPPIAPAVVNAVFAATGKRIRQLPIGSQLAIRS